MRLRVDPRTAGWREFNIKPPHGFNSPSNIQRKILALDASGVSVVAQAPPGEGKSSAALLACLNSPPSRFSSLVLVPAPALAEQWAATANKWNQGSACALYRTGNVAADEAQHAALKSETGILICTPNRLLDYLDWSPQFLSSPVRRLVIDELDTYSTKSCILRDLVNYITAVHQPVVTCLTTQETPNSDLGLQLISLADHEPKWTGKIITHDLATQSKFKGDKWKSKELVRALAQLWNVEGPGLVVVPRSQSVVEVEQGARRLGIPATVVKAIDVQGIKVPDLKVLYILGNEDVDRLKWLARDKVIVIS